jgi:Zn-dependent protease
LLPDIVVINHGARMFGKRYQLFRLLGFSVYIDLSWLIVATLVAWSLAVGVFPERFSGLSNLTYWMMGITAMVGLFVSIIGHELAHSVVARRMDIPISGITLFIFGGVAHMDEEPRSGRSELLMAVAGPAASLILAAVCVTLDLATRTLGWPAEVGGVLGYLGWINLVVAGFNLLPAFPLDGGRVLRAALWSLNGDLRWATRISSLVGSTIGLALIAIGVLAFIGGHTVGGLWWFLIGMFLRSAAQQSYKQALLRRVFDDVPISQLLHGEPVTVSKGTTVQSMIDDYVNVHHHDVFPVLVGDTPLGYVSVRRVHGVPEHERSSQRVEEIMVPRSDENTIGVEEGVSTALTKLKHPSVSYLLVVDGRGISGVVSLEDLKQYLSLNVHLETGDDSATVKH